MAALLAACALTPASAPARSTSPATPYMGVDTWYAFGPDIDEHTVVALTNAVVHRGLKAAGYRYVWIDGGWWNGTRDADGTIVVDPSQWPHGMRWLASYIHSKGLLAGIYTDVGKTGCSNGGSYGHYQSDIDTFAKWGFDAVKVDFCGGSAMHLDAHTAYGEIHQAIVRDHPHRRMLLNVCNGSVPNEYGHDDPSWANSAYASYQFGPAIATSWRTGPDVGKPGKVEFDQVLRNLDLDAKHPGVAGHGHWNDPDYIVPDEGMTFQQARAQFTMWTIVAAPLIVSDDLETLPTKFVSMLTNAQAIEISQDRRGIQGRLIAREGSAQVWVKPLADGDRAVAFLNRGLAPAQASATGRMLGLGAQRRFVIRDVWTGRVSRATGRIDSVVPPGGAVLLRLRPTSS